MQTVKTKNIVRMDVIMMKMKYLWVCVSEPHAREVKIRGGDYQGIVTYCLFW